MCFPSPAKRAVNNDLKQEPKLSNSLASHFPFSQAIPFWAFRVHPHANQGIQHAHLHQRRGDRLRKFFSTDRAVVLQCRTSMRSAIARSSDMRRLEAIDLRVPGSSSVHKVRRKRGRTELHSLLRIYRSMWQRKGRGGQPYEVVRESMRKSYRIAMHLCSREPTQSHTCQCHSTGSGRMRLGNSHRTSNLLLYFVHAQPWLHLDCDCHIFSFRRHYAPSFGGSVR